jgi:hypothetical protein
VTKENGETLIGLEFGKELELEHKFLAIGLAFVWDEAWHRRRGHR